MPPERITAAVLDRPSPAIGHDEQFGMRITTIRTIALSVCVLSTPIVSASAQHAAPTSPRSTQTGVYTTEQATRGQDLYAGICQSCHTPISHSDAAFQKTWSGRSLWSLFAFIQEMMPKNDPGTLPASEVSDVVAYLLRLNRMPSGRHELPADSAALRMIRIETAPSAVEPARPR